MTMLGCLLCTIREETVSAKFGAVVQPSDFLKTNGVFYRVKVTNKGTLEGGVSVLAVMTTKVRNGALYSGKGYAVYQWPIGNKMMR